MNIIMPVLLGFAAVGLFAYGVTIYNGLVRLKNNINKAWGNIDVLLKQRHDELPKLIKTCEAYMKYEKDTLTQVIEARNSAQRATTVGDRAKKEGELTGLLHKLFALAENYPDLKAQSNFQHLQTRISGLENEIADRREFYNDSVNNYNIRIESFPDSILAGWMKLAAREMFKISEADRRDVAIEFNMP